MVLVKREIIDVEARPVKRARRHGIEAKRVMASGAIALFSYVANKLELAEPSDKVQSIDRRLRWITGFSVLCVLSPVGLLQMGYRHPLALMLPNSLALALVSDGKKLKKDLDWERRLGGVNKHVDGLLAERQIVADRFVEHAPISNPGGIGGKLVSSLTARKIYVNLIGVIDAPSFHRIKITPTGDLTIDKLRALAETLQTSLGVNNPPIVSAHADYWTLDVERREREFVKFEEFAPQLEGYRTDPVTLPVGVNIERQLIEVSTLNPLTCQLLVGGTTGSGKSEFLRCCIRWLMQWSPQTVQITIVDPKFVTFMDFMSENPNEASPYQDWLPHGVIESAAMAAAVLEELVEEMERRYKLFQAARVSNIGKYNELQRSIGLPILPLHYFVCDEYADLISNDKHKKAIEALLIRLGQKARACGICLMLGTQRPSMKVLIPELRENLVWRVGMLMTNTAGSYIIMGGEPGDGTMAGSANCLMGSGDMISDIGRGIERYQALYWDGTSKPQVFHSPKPAVASKPVEPRVVIPAVEIEKGAEIVEAMKTPSVPTPKVEVIEPAEPDPGREIYLKYRAHREEGLAPYKFFEANFGKASLEVKIDVERRMSRFFPEWIDRLNQQEKSVEQIVKAVWNLSENDKRGGELFRAKVGIVKQILGGSDDSLRD